LHERWLMLSWRLIKERSAAAMDANTIEPKSAACSILLTSYWTFRMKFEMRLPETRWMENEYDKSGSS
jgi:hypothetical protein